VYHTGQLPNLTTRPLASPGATREELEEAHGWTLHQLRHSLLTHEAEDGTSTPMLLARSRHASVRSLERYARPAPRPSPATSPSQTQQRAVASPGKGGRQPASLLPGRDPNRCFYAG
jgi:hypothetical protein